MIGRESTDYEQITMMENPEDDINWYCEIIDNQSVGSIVWLVDVDEVAQKMLTRCRAALPYTQPFDIDEREGYNGVKFYNKWEKYGAFMGKMRCEFRETVELKTDLGRKLEQLVLLNAPDQYRSKALAILTIDFD